jgi:hypothetical protein
LARELLAFAALKEGEKDSAIADFRKLADDATAPDGVRSRAATILGVLGAGPVAQAEPPSPPSPQP